MNFEQGINEQIKAYEETVHKLYEAEGLSANTVGAVEKLRIMRALVNGD